MAMPESPIPAPILMGAAQSLERLVAATQQSAIATLAAAIVAARGKPTSINEVLEISHDLHMAMFPPHGSGMLKEWMKTKDQRLAKVRD